MPPVNSSVGRDKRTLSSFPSLKGKGEEGMGKKRRRDSRRKRSIGWYRYAEGKERRAGGRRWRSGDNGLSIWFLFSFFCPEINSPMAMVTERGGKKERCVS